MRKARELRDGSGGDRPSAERLLLERALQDPHVREFFREIVREVLDEAGLLDPDRPVRPPRAMPSARRRRLEAASLRRKQRALAEGLVAKDGPQA